MRQLARARRCQSDEKIAVIGASGFVGFAGTAAGALVRNNKFAMVQMRAHRAHQCPTRRGPVTWPHINMTRPQTRRAMIGISRANHQGTTIAAGEVFFRTLKLPGHTWSV